MSTHIPRLSALAGLFVALAIAGCSKQPDILVATMETTYGTMVIQLFEDITPRTVENFVGLAEGTKTWKAVDGTEKNEPFYDGLTFHRVIKDFMIQGGCPLGNGTGDPGFKFEDECYAGHFEILSGKINDEDMAHDVFNVLIVPYFKKTHFNERNQALVELVKSMDAQRSYDLMVGMTVEQISELVGNTEPVRKFVKDLTPVSGEIKDTEIADTVFNAVFAPHIREHNGVSPIPEVKALHEEIMAADGPDPLIGKTVEELQALVGHEGEVGHPKLLGKVDYGAFCMANSGPNSNGSQFFIVTKEEGAEWLNGRHTVFGKVIEGMEVALAIQEVETNDSSKPVEPVEILSVEIDRIPEPGG